MAASLELGWGAWLAELEVNMTPPCWTGTEPKDRAMELVLATPTYHFEKKISSPGQKMTIDL